MTYFERALCRLARVWGAAWRGNRLDASVVEQEIRPLLRLPLWRRQTDWSSSARLLLGPARRSKLYVLAVDAATQHGSQAVERMREAFEREWDGDAGAYWPNSARREVILALWRAGVSQNWTLTRLGELEGRMTKNNDVSSRVDEHKERVDALSELGEGELARSSLRGMLSVSLGVGYEKDYQLDTWIRWLRRINEVEPERCAERIGWLSWAILALKTESSTHSDAASELLRVCFRWSPRRAVALLWWFSERGVILHEEGVRSLLREALERGAPPTGLIVRCLGDIVLPIAARPDPKLAESAIEQTAHHQGTDEAVEAARLLARKARIYGFSSKRSAWLYGVSQALKRLGVHSVREACIAPEDARRESEENWSSTLELEGESGPLSAEEVERRASSPSGLRRLLEEQAGNSYYQWELLLKPLVPSLNSKETRELADLFRGKRHGSLALAMLSKRLHDLGDAEGAWSIGLQALDSSDALLGWRRWGDGGSRLASLNALIYADAARAYPIALRTLVQDLTDEALYFQSIALNLEEILPLLAKDIPIRETWREVERYLDALFEGSALPSEEPVCLEQARSDDTARTAVAELVTSHLDHPVGLLSQAALRACGNCLLEEATASET